jgi:hypothetical protein
MKIGFQSLDPAEQIRATSSAFRSLRMACNEQSGGLYFLKLGPRFDAQRLDPRFQDLLRCIGVMQ